jgi:hypothetical protein
MAAAGAVLHLAEWSDANYMAAMFKILGADGKEYGPVTVDQINQWIREGRANQETMMQRQGEFGWKPLGQHAEFAGVLNPQPPVVSPAPLPTVSTASAAGGPNLGARARAVQMVSGPAIGLMITAGLGFAVNALSIIMRLVRVASPPPPPELPPELVRVFEIMNGPVAIVAGIIGLAISLFVLYGALKMQKLTSRGLVIAAAIVAMVPCFSPCCLVGLPIGIWALVVLSKPEVRSQFA